MVVSPISHRVRKRASETRQHIATFERARPADLGHAPIGFMDAHESTIGVHNPDEKGSGTQPVGDLGEYFAGPIVG